MNDSEAVYLLQEESNPSNSNEKNLLPRQSTLWNTTSYILVSVIFQNFAYYGLVGSIVLFFQRILKLSNAQSDVQFSLWYSICFITPLFGGIIGDSILSRYSTILIFFIISVIGFIVIELSILPYHTVSNAGFFLGIYILAFGQGGVVPNISTIGADQFDEKYEKDKLEKQSFFNYFYWMINVGAFLANTVLAYICQQGVKGFGGVDNSFFAGFGIATIMITLASISFFLGSSKYRVVKSPKGDNMVYKAIRISYEAFIHKFSILRPSSGLLIDKARICNGGSFGDTDVDNVRDMLRLFPFLFAMIPYWACYSQVCYSFICRNITLRCHVFRCQQYFKIKDVK